MFMFEQNFIENFEEFELTSTSRVWDLYLQTFKTQLKFEIILRELFDIY